MTNFISNDRIAENVAESRFISFDGIEAQDKKEKRICNGLISWIFPPMRPFGDNILHLSNLFIRGKLASDES
jgi:hypothetical protein